MNRWLRAFYKRLGILQVGRRRVRDLIDFIEDRKIDVVIDVGANIGQFGEYLRKQGFKGRIVSFEPTISAFQALQVKAAADGNWQAHQFGLGATAGEAAIHVSQLSVCSSILPLTGVALLHDSRVAEDHSEKIALRTLDEIASGLTGNVLLKIDTQGYEKQVLEGGRHTMARSLGILIELPIIHVYQGEWQFHEAVKFMGDAGFVLAQIQPVNYHGADNVSVIELDCLFRPRSHVDGVRNPIENEIDYMERANA